VIAEADRRGHAGRGSSTAKPVPFRTFA
jgi:hypothetical protein